jgi:mannose-6-phosphate isomerase-like protein (cupin superfamily)
MKVSLAPLLASLPKAATQTWPGGEPFTEALRHGTMSVEVFAPRVVDAQEPHEQDELYFVMLGTARFNHAGKEYAVAAGDALFVAAGDRHHFLDMSEDFVTWVVFWGPKGGEVGEVVVTPPTLKTMAEPA